MSVSGVQLCRLMGNPSCWHQQAAIKHMLRTGIMLDRHVHFKKRWLSRNSTKAILGICTFRAKAPGSAESML
jgi:hypothetical protein